MNDNEVARVMALAEDREYALGALDDYPWHAQTRVAVFDLTNDHVTKWLCGVDVVSLGEVEAHISGRTE